MSGAGQIGRLRIWINGRHFSTLNTSLRDLITFAYGLTAGQIAGAPRWFETDKYDVRAQPDREGLPSDQQWKTMLQTLLADRFKLTFHRDKRELPVYAIAVVKSGPRLIETEGDPSGLPSLFFREPGVLPGRNATIADLASVMQADVLDRPVLDRTGLQGRYDFLLKWASDGARAGNSPAPDLFTAFRDQLGLTLESTKAPVEIFVIDRAEKPSEN